MALGLKKTLPGDPDLIRLFLFGPITVMGEDDQELTPRSKKARAVLAMLALAPRGVRSRVWLRHMLWGSKPEAQGAASLRQSLLEIRRALGAVENRCIQADKNTVALNLNIIDVDYLKALKQDTALDRDRYAPDYLMEGLDLSEPEFTDWLNKERQTWARRLDSTGVSLQLEPKAKTDTSQAQTYRPPAEAATKQMRVCLLPPMMLGDTQNAVQLLPKAYRLLDNSLQDAGDFLCFEPQATFREHWERSNANWLADIDQNADLAFQFRSFGSGDATKFALTLQQPSTGRFLWQSETALVSNIGTGLDRSVYRLIATAMEKTQLKISTDLPDLQTKSVCSTALSTMMRLSAPDIDKAEVILTDAMVQNDSPQLHALMAFLITFRVGQRFQFEDAALIERAQDHTNVALNDSRPNALVGALTAHVHSYLFGEYDFAAGLYEKALRHNPTQVLAWDLYSMLHAYAGQPRKALAMANWACFLGAESPHRYYFETTRAITACFSGQHETALNAGEYAIAQRPDFNSILRVLVSSAAHLDQMELAATYLHRLRQVEPDFTIEALRDAGYPGLDTAGGQHFVEGLLKAGVRAK